MRKSIRGIVLSAAVAAVALQASAEWAFTTDAQPAGVCSGRITKSGKLEAEIHSSAAEGRWENVLPVGGKE